MLLLQNFCNQLNDMHQKYQDLNKLSINSFNIFSILRKPNDEVNLHSRFIFELLNPEGSHQQGDTFLKLFFKELELEYRPNIYQAFREKENIDILLTSHTKAIIIENKIDTEDHSNQLSRYYEQIQEDGYRENQITFFYLTLFEEKPNEIEMRDKVKNITYQYEICNWIESAIKEMVKFPILRDTLVQYLNLIKQLTDQSQEKGFILEVKDLLLEEDNLKAMLNIEASVVEAKIDVQLSFWKDLKTALDEHYPFDFYALNGEKTLKRSVQKYYKKRKNRKDFGFEYEVDKNLYFFIELRNNIYYGFDFRNEPETHQQERVNALWVDWEEGYWKYSEPELNFELFNTENVLDLIDSEKRKKIVDKIVDEITTLIRQYQNFKKEVS